MIKFGLYKRKSPPYSWRNPYHSDLFILLTIEEHNKQKYATVLNIRTLHEMTIAVNFLELVQS